MYLFAEFTLLYDVNFVSYFSVAKFVLLEELAQDGMRYVTTRFISITN